jgi:hypothetical protein
MTMRGLIMVMLLPLSLPLSADEPSSPPPDPAALRAATERTRLPLWQSGLSTQGLRTNPPIPIHYQ